MGLCWESFARDQPASVKSDGNFIVIYKFGRNLAPEKPIVSDALIDLHAKMRANKELDHDFSEAEVDELAMNIIIRKSCR
jgi:hypothetical protein